MEDIDSELIEIDVEDYDAKLAVSDEIDINQNCIPTLNIKNSDNTPITHHFLKTYFELEKIKAKIPNSDKTTPVLVLFDGGSGTTVGNHLEDLDEYETQQTKNIILSSLNGVDRSQKRVCQVTLIGEDDREIPLNVVIPSELIPKPGAQSMEEFQQDQKHKGQIKWVDPITKDDIDNLPLILLGLNYRKYFPQQVPDNTFTKKFLKNHPDIVFSKSALSGKTMATGIRESGLVNVLQFGYHEYSGEDENLTHKLVKLDFSDSNESMTHQLQNTDLADIHKIEQVFLQNQTDIITINDDENNDSTIINEVIQGDLPYIDQNTLSLIHTLQVKDHEIHTGQDEDTIILVNKLEKERELEQRNYDIEREKEAAKILEKTEDNFPNLEKPKKSSQ